MSYDNTSTLNGSHVAIFNLHQLFEIKPLRRRLWHVTVQGVVGLV